MSMRFGEELKVVVISGGVTGLTFALAAGRQEYKGDIFERVFLLELTLLQYLISQ